MADRTIKVITPAANIGMVTLDEAKTLLGITLSTPESDEQLQFLIDINSATIMRYCNRIFAKEKVQESWRDIGGRRVFLSHWPVAEADIESVYSGDTLLDPTGYELEEASGKVSNFNGWIEPVVITYTGGYELPAECPLPLKQATALLIREAKFMATLVTAAGMRSISHKEKRVQFFDTNKMLGSSAGSVTPMHAAVNSLLVHYTRWEV